MAYMQLLAVHWKDAVFWLLWNLAAMVGLWGTGLAIFFFLENPLWLQLFDKGQLFLYSAGFLGQAMYILSKEYETRIIPYRRALVWCTVVCFGVCVLLFCGSVLSNFSDGPSNTTRTEVLRYAGLCVLLFSIFIGLLVTIADEGRGVMDYARLANTGVLRLEKLIPEGSEE